MLVRTRRRRNCHFLQVKMPVNAQSRTAVDEEIERIRRCVIPLIRAEAGKPFLEGSAVALIYRGQRCLITALHVLTANEGRPVLFFGHDSYARQLHGEFEASEAYDIAATVLDADTIAALAHIPFLEEERIGSSADASGGFYASVAGYPHTASRLADHQTLDTPMEVVSNKAIEHPDGVITVAFDKKDGAWGAGGHVLARDPIGKSGGAIFGMPLLGLNGVQPWAAAKLAGIPTDWRGKQIIGAGIAALLPLLDELIQTQAKGYG